MRKVIFGIRKSKLARIQLDEFIAYLNQNEIKIEFGVKTITAKGDRHTDIPIEKLGPGVFTKELERALLSGEIDCAIHSLKDMPTEIEKGTALCCFAPRADERDCLLYREGVAVDGLKMLQIATGSVRRTVFLKELEPKIKTVSLRGNIETRLRKLKNGRFDAMVLAACAVKRIGAEKKIGLYFDSNTFVPAAGQGVICAQSRDDDGELNYVLRNISCADTEICVISERRVLEELGVGCRMPFGVFARFEGNEFAITAKAYIKEKNSCAYCELRGARAEYERLTNELIERIRMEFGREEKSLIEKV